LSTFDASSAGVAAVPRKSVAGSRTYSIPTPAARQAPPSVGSAHAALSFLRQHPERVSVLHRQSAYFLARAREDGLDCGSAIGKGVVPIFFDSPQQTMYVAQHLLSRGIYAPPIVQVGVPKDQPRIRFFISAAHTKPEIDRVINAVSEAVHETTVGMQSSRVRSRGNS